MTRIRILVVLLVSLLLASVFGPGRDVGSAVGGLGGSGLIGNSGQGPTPQERSRIRQAIEAYEATLPRVQRANGPERYPFYPQGGNLNEDLWVNNFVDLDPTMGILDWDCSDYTLNRHRAHDTDIRTFGEQAIGVPVFAALDGTVVDLHDGEPDMNTSCTGLANYVILDHGGTHFSWYFHLKNGSVAVSLNDTVTAGTQLGLTASSGCSTQPHLHFQSQYQGAAYEPSAGACRAGQSFWVDQAPVRRDLYLWDFTLNSEGLSGWAGLPFDTSRTGTFVGGAGPTTIYFWFAPRNLRSNSNWRVRFRRPNGSIALDRSARFGRNPFLRNSWWWYSWSLGLDQTGTWDLLFDINSVTLVEAPFDVVSSAAQIVNRPPYPITVSFDPSTPRGSEVIFCRVSTSLTLDDPDYEIVRYRYEWRVNSTTVRDVTHAGQADAIPRDFVTVGDTVECEVTPSDGLASGPTASTSALVSLDECGNVNGDTAVDFSDAVMIAQATLIPPLVTMIHPRACDADGNGACDIFDALRVAQATLTPPLAAIVQECEAATVLAAP